MLMLLYPESGVPMVRRDAIGSYRSRIESEKSLQGVSWPDLLTAANCAQRSAGCPFRSIGRNTGNAPRSCFTSQSPSVWIGLGFGIMAQKYVRKAQKSPHFREKKPEMGISLAYYYSNRQKAFIHLRQSDGEQECHGTELPASS